MPSVDDDSRETLLDNDDVERPSSHAIDDEPSTSSSSRVTFGQLFRLARDDARALALGTATLLLRLPFSIAMPHFMSRAIGAAMDGDRDKFVSNVSRFTVVGVVNAALDFWNVFLFALARTRIIERLRVRAFAMTLGKSMTWFDARASGTTASILANDANEVGGNLTWVLRACVESAARVCGIGAYLLFWVNFRLGILALVVVPISSAVNYFYGRRVSASAEKVQDALASANAVVCETLANIRTVRSFAKENYERRRFAGSIEKWYDASYRAAVLTGVYYTVMYSFLGACAVPAMILYAGGRLVIAGDMHAEKLVATMLYSAILQEYFGNLLSSFTNLFAARGAAKELFKILERDDAFDVNADEGIVIEPLSDVRGEITFENVSFAYPTRPEISVLSGLSFSIAPNEVVALKGPSGSGKSTVISLVQRFYGNYTGKITLDGVDVKTLKPNWLRSKVFALVGQEPVLFAGSVLSNIAYGAGTVDVARVKSCAKLALIHDVIESELGGYDAVVGERGCTISGGQKQRIAIARALYADPKVLLLDEPTSALDVDAERIVIQALRESVKNRTAIVISHKIFDALVDDDAFDRGRRFIHRDVVMSRRSA